MIAVYNFKRRFVMPIRLGLGILDDPEKCMPCTEVFEPGSRTPVPFDPAKHLDPSARPKRQTIRAQGLRRHAQPGDTVRCYHGMRTKQCFKIGDGLCTGSSKIYLDFRCGVLQVQGRPRVSNDIALLDDFARRDGFNDWADIRKFWKEEYDAVTFLGVLIEWEAMP